MANDSVIIAAATRPYPGESHNGDAWQVDWHDGRCRVAIIDGLGHGELAADAAHLARTALAQRPELSPADGLRLCHAALTKSRGAAISIALVDPILHRLTYCGVGNVEACLRSNSHVERLIAYRGIVGATLPNLHTFTHELGPDWALVMYTDGIRSRFTLDPFSETDENTQAMADRILDEWARGTDDATVLVARAAT